MLDIAPEKVYITEELQARPQCMDRAERMIAAMDPGEVSVVSLAELNDVVEERGWKTQPRWGTIEQPRDPDIVFAVARFDGDDGQKALLARYPNLDCRDLAGYHTLYFRPHGEPWAREQRKGTICQSAWQLHSVIGCPFRCAYCSFGGVNRVLVNIEDYLDHLDDWLALAGDQRLWKWDNYADVNCFEPEYGASELFVEYFARQEDRYLEIYAGKSDNVDYLLPLEHNGRTIIQWSIGGPTQTSVFEPRTASWEERIEAARKCQQAGYTVRYRFSPIIPVKGWREESTALIERIFERTAPDVISLCAFGWMDLDDAERCLDFGELDPDFVAAMRAAAPFLRETGYTAGGGRPIPHDARRVLFEYLIGEIRRVSPDTVVALCLETEEMWHALGAQLGQTPDDYVCNCGPLCTPGAPLYDRMVPERPPTSA
ncbi:MAG: spore photoproduct lyase family protein [Armatimonadota bacterium]